MQKHLYFLNSQNLYGLALFLDDFISFYVKEVLKEKLGIFSQISFFISILILSFFFFPPPTPHIVLYLWDDLASSLLERILMMKEIEGKSKKGRHRISCLNSITDSVDMNLRKLWELVKDRGAWHATVHAARCSKSQTQISNGQQTILSTPFPSGSHCLALLLFTKQAFT